MGLECGFQGLMMGSLGGCRAARKNAVVLTGCGKKSQSSSAAAVRGGPGWGCRQAVARLRHPQGKCPTSPNQNLHSGQQPFTSQSQQDVEALQL